MIKGRTYYQLLQVDPSADTEVTGTSSSGWSGCPLAGSTAQR
jgi:hypothetical protein